MFILLVGNLISGYKTIGPFKTTIEGSEYYKKHYIGKEEYIIFPLASPWEGCKK